jgi:serine beta-lactamase-like protein LACTB
VKRSSTWLALIVLAIAVVFAIVAGVWQYAHAVPPLYPDAKAIPSSMEGSPSPKWADAIEKGRQLALTSVKEQNLPGLSVAVGFTHSGQAGDIVWAEGFGWADLDDKVPVTPNLRFRVGHASNALTSAAVGVLRERGRLHLDDEIQKYVPEFPKKQWPITVRQLMSNVAGIIHYSGEEADVPSGHCERAVEGVASFAGKPLLFEPGTEYRYSTYGHVLVSAAIEAAANEPFFSFMQTGVFAPLGMKDTLPDSATTKIPNRATFYFPRFSGDNAFGHEIARPVDYSCFAGAGAFLSTPSDLVRFGTGLLGGPLLQTSTVRLLQTPQVLTSGKETAYGLGWMLETVDLGGEPTQAAGHASRSLLGASTSFFTFPDRGLVVAVTSNTSYADTRSIAVQMARIFAMR